MSRDVRRKVLKNHRIQTLEKRDIALQQLRAAAKHYNNGEYVCSVTLSGAADEILGAIAKKRTNYNHFEGAVEFLKGVYRMYGVNNPSEKELIKHVNRIKNEFKHNDHGQNNWVEGDFEMEAATLFVRAVKNYFDAYNELPNDRIIRRLFDHLTL